MDDGTLDHDQSPLACSPLYFAASRKCPVGKAALFLAHLSVEKAKEHMDFLLRKREQLCGSVPGNSLDEVIALILDDKKLLQLGVTGDEELNYLLNSSHNPYNCNHIPLCRVIVRVAPLVKNGKFVNSCLQSVINHLTLYDGNLLDEDLQLLSHTLSQLLRTLMAIIGRFRAFPEYYRAGIYRALTVRKYSPDSSVLQSVAELIRRPWGSEEDMAQHYFRNAVLHHMSSLSERYKKSYLDKQPSCQISELMRPLRIWIEVDLESSPGRESSFPQCPAFADALDSLLCERNKGMIKCLLTLSLWLSAAGARLDRSNRKHCDLFQDVLKCAPSVAEAVLVQVPCLQQICARAIRHHLPGCIAVSSSRLPLSGFVQRYVAGGFLDTGIWRVDELTAAGPFCRNWRARKVQ